MRNAGRSARIVHRAAFAVTFGAALAAASASATAVPDPEPQDPIIVTGTPLTREQIRDRAAEFVRGTGVASGRTPVARWVYPVCLRIVGLAPTQATAVETRMRAIAGAAGIRLAGDGCNTNVWVTFTADAGAVVREVARRSGRRLAEVPPGARDALLNGDSPVRWWYLTDTRSRHGLGSKRQSLQIEGGVPNQGEGGSGGSNPISVEAIQHYDSSVISTQVHRFLISATVIVDADSVAGQSLDAIAAYAAMVAFAEIRDADFAPSGSILGLFAAPGAPRELTAEDMAFLRALYRLPLDRQAQRHRGRLVMEMVAAATGKAVADTEN